MQKVDIIIVGAGLAGCWVSYYAQHAGLRLAIFDVGGANASQAASGIINPVSGFRYAQTWHITEAMPFAVAAYQNINRQLINPSNSYELFATTQLQQAFEQRIQKNENNFLGYKNNTLQQYFNYANPQIGQITPSYYLNVPNFLAQCKTQLKQQLYFNTPFNYQQVQINSAGVQYQNILANAIIFCEGHQVQQNPFLQKPIINAVKGEALIILPQQNLPIAIYKNNYTLAPYSNNQFWVGSSFSRNYSNANPSTTFKQETTKWLQQFYKHHFTLTAHIAGIRPTTPDRKPVVGFLQNNPRIGFLNGLGTKGVTYAPFFANELVQNYLHKKNINKAAHINRLNL
jgi:glycine/D-amino acid oxidase-like deaminating enzyme